MKQILFTTLALAFGHHLSAQVIEGFESDSLPLDSFRNGSNTKVGFQFSNLNLINNYDTSFGGFWDGFSISTMRDDTTAGFSNQYSAITAGGRQSNVYAVGYSSAQIKIAPPVDQSIQLEGAYVTNSTYTYLSMLNGDNFAKKFGGSSGDDPDYYRVHAVLEMPGYRSDTLTYSLADYTFKDNDQDYIIDTWEWFDLSGFDTLISDTAYLTFSFSSSDTSFGFINTPTYLCLDDISYSTVLGLSTARAASAITFVSKKDGIEITSESKGIVDVFDISGQRLHRTPLMAGKTYLTSNDLARGWNVVVLNSQTESQSIKVFSP